MDSEIILIPKRKQVQNCTIIKSAGVFGSRPIKYLPQTNLLHKKKVKKCTSDPKISLKNANYVLYTINNCIKVKVLYSLKLLLDKITSRRPRCKVFRDMYDEKVFNEEDIVYNCLFTLDSEFPLEDFSLLKNDFEMVIISSKKLLIFNDEEIFIDNNSLMIYNRRFPPVRENTLKSKTSHIPEYTIINFPLLSSKKTLQHSPSFKTVLTHRKN